MYIREEKHLRDAYLVVYQNRKLEGQKSENFENKRGISTSKEIRREDKFIILNRERLCLK